MRREGRGGEREVEKELEKEICKGIVGKSHLFSSFLNFNQFRGPLFHLLQANTYNNDIITTLFSDGMITSLALLYMQHFNEYYINDDIITINDDIITIIYYMCI